MGVFSPALSQLCRADRGKHGDSSHAGGAVCPLVGQEFGPVRWREHRSTRKNSTRAGVGPFPQAPSSTWHSGPLRPDTAWRSLFWPFQDSSRSACQRHEAVFFARSRAGGVLQLSIFRDGPVISLSELLHCGWRRIAVCVKPAFLKIFIDLKEAYCLVKAHFFRIS